jgi:uncharacterized protein (TIGR03083 family)
MEGREVDALELQSKDLLALLDELSIEEWERPTRCPGWTVKELAAHCEGMMQRLVTYNSQAVEGPAEIDRVGYYGYDPDGPREGEDPNKTFSEVIKDRVVEEAGSRSPSEIRAGVESSMDEMLRSLAEIPADRVIKRSGHPKMTFGELVATRVLEFGVHSMDISHATLRGERIHPDAVSIITEILRGRLGADLPVGMGWDGRTFILAGTGRRRLEPNERFTLGPLAAKFPLLS